MSRPTIAIAIPTLNRGGAERVLVSVARKLAGSGFPTILMTLNGSGTLRAELPADVRLIVLKASRSSLCVPELARAFGPVAPDLIVSTTHHMNVASALAARLAGIANVALRCPNMPGDETRNGDLGWLVGLAAGWAYRSARHVIAQTEEMKADMVSRFGVDARRVRVLHNPVDAELIEQRLAGAANPYDPRRINVVTAGRLSRQKGIDTLIRSFSAVVAKDSRYLLHLLGRDGGEKRALKERVRALDLTDHVVFWGEQDNPYPFLKFCDLFVLASRWEGLPNVILECIYLGKRIVTTRSVPILERLIQNGENGFIVPVDDEAALSEAILAHEALTAPYRPLPSEDVVSFFEELAAGRAE